MSARIYPLFLPGTVTLAIDPAVGPNYTIAARCWASFALHNGDVVSEDSANWRCVTHIPTGLSLGTYRRPAAFRFVARLYDLPIDWTRADHDYFKGVSYLYNPVAAEAEDDSIDEWITAGGL